MLEEDLPLAELRRMLEEKRGEVRYQVQEGLERLERIDARLK